MSFGKYWDQEIQEWLKEYKSSNVLDDNQDDEHEIDAAIYIEGLMVPDNVLREIEETWKTISELTSLDDIREHNNNLKRDLLSRHPYLWKIMDKHNCERIRESTENVLEHTWYIKYSEWDHHGIIYYIVDYNWEDIRRLKERSSGLTDVEWFVIDDNQCEHGQKVCDELNRDSTAVIYVRVDADPNSEEIVLIDLEKMDQPKTFWEILKKVA